MRHATPRRPSPRPRLVSIVLCSFLLLAACGGGGAGSGPVPVDMQPPGPPPPPPAREAQWLATPIQIDSPAASGAAGSPTLVADGAGNVMAAWTQVRDGRTGISSSFYRAATASWTDPVALEAPDAGDAGRPALAVDSRGNVIAMWSQANGPQSGTIHARRYDAALARWNDTEQVRTAEKAQDPILVVDQADNLVSAWRELHPESGLQLLVSSRFHQGSWSAPQQLSSADAFGVPADPVMAVAADGKVIVAWAEEPLTGSAFIIVKASRFDGATWSPPERIDAPVASASGSFSYAPALVADGSARATLAWIQEDAEGVFIFASRFDGEAWTAPTRISSESGSAGHAVRVAADSAGTVTAVWDEFDAAGVHVLSSSRFSPLAGGWTPPVQVGQASTQDTTPVSTGLALAARPAGDLVVVWTSFTTRTIVASSRYVAATDRWITPEQIDDPATEGDAAHPFIALHGVGQATAAWVQLKGGRAVINSNRLE